MVDLRIYKYSVFLIKEGENIRERKPEGLKANMRGDISVRTDKYIVEGGGG